MIQPGVAVIRLYAHNSAHVRSQDLRDCLANYGLCARRKTRYQDIKGQHAIASSELSIEHPVCLKRITQPKVAFQARATHSPSKTQMIGYSWSDLLGIPNSTLRMSSIVKPYVANAIHAISEGAAPDCSD